MRDIWRGTKAQPDTQFAVSDTRWITTQISEDFFEVLLRLPEKTRPLLLILDGHVSHLSITTTELAKK